MTKINFYDSDADFEKYASFLELFTQENPLDIKTQTIGKHVLVRLAGRLDITQSDEVESHLAKDVLSGEGDIIIHLGSISYISSSGIRIFVGMVRELNRQGRKLKLCNITPPVKKVFDVVELLDLFDVYATEEEAIASLP